MNTHNVLRRPRTGLARIGLFVGVLLGCIVVGDRVRATAQEGAGPTAPNQQQQEMVELFGKVERRLREIDRLLSDASAGEGSITGAGASGIDELLKQTSTHGEDVKQGIDELLRIAEQMSQQQQSSSGSGSGGEQQPGEQGKSPIDGRGQQSAEREQTPGGQRPRPQGQDGRGEQGQKPENRPGGADPKDGRDSPSTPENRPAGDPSSGARGVPEQDKSGRDRWGDLPVHARDVFQSAGGGDMPARYRDWIDAYYRRLNKQP